MTDMVKITYWTDNDQTEAATATIPAKVYLMVCAIRADLLVTIAEQYLESIVTDPASTSVDVATVELVEECARLYKNANTLPGGIKWNFCAAAAVALRAIRECAVELNCASYGLERAKNSADACAEQWRNRSDKLESKQIRRWLELETEKMPDSVDKVDLFCGFREAFTP